MQNLKMETALICENGHKKEIDSNQKELICSDLICINEQCIRDKKFRKFLSYISLTTITIVFLIIFFLILEAFPAFIQLDLNEFLFGQHWLPTIENPHYGALPIIGGTLLVAAGAILFAIPLSLAGAIFISEIAPPKLRLWMKSLVEILAGIPSVVYGYFGLIILTRWIRISFNQISGSSWLAGSLLLGVMALPTIISVSEDALSAVPQEYREASLALGATKWQTIRQVTVPSAFSGITAAITLGIGRVIGETMAVMMVTGNTAKFPNPLYNVFDTVRTITGTLAIEIGEVPQGSLHYSSLFALGVILMLIVFAINKGSNAILQRMKHKFHPPEVGKTPNKIQRKWHQLIQTTRFKLLKSKLKFMVQGLALALFALLLWRIHFSFFLLLGIFILFRKFGPQIKPLLREKIAFGSILMGVGLILFALFLLIFHIVYNGISAGVIDFQFLTDTPRDNGRAGGILPAIMGTLLLVLGAILIAVPLGIASGIYLSEYAKDTRLTRFIRLSIDNLNGTPSIIFGLFGFAFFVITLGWGISLIAGQITLSFLILPTIIRTTEEALASVPLGQREASLALGAGKWQTITEVVIPQAKSGIVTGVILSMGRVAGETAPIMLTATVLTQRYITMLPTQPVMALPYHLYMLSTNIPGAGDYAAATALVLLIIVLSFYFVANIIRIKADKSMKT